MLGEKNTCSFCERGPQLSCTCIQILDAYEKLQVHNSQLSRIEIHRTFQPLQSILCFEHVFAFKLPTKASYLNFLIVEKFLSVSVLCVCAHTHTIKKENYSYHFYLCTFLYQQVTQPIYKFRQTVHMPYSTRSNRIIDIYSYLQLVVVLLKLSEYCHVLYSACLSSITFYVLAQKRNTVTLSANFTSKNKGQ